MGFSKAVANSKHLPAIVLVLTALNIAGFCYGAFTGTHFEFASARVNFILSLFYECLFVWLWLHFWWPRRNHPKTSVIVILTLMMSAVVIVAFFKLVHGMWTVSGIVEPLVDDRLAMFDRRQAVELPDHSRLSLYVQDTGPLSPFDVLVFHEIPVGLGLQQVRILCRAPGDRDGWMKYDEKNGRISLDVSRGEKTRHVEFSLNDQIELDSD